MCPEWLLFQVKKMEFEYQALANRARYLEDEHAAILKSLAGMHAAHTRTHARTHDHGQTPGSAQSDQQPMTGPSDGWLFTR